jgi:hypothetical protein
VASRSYQFFAMPDEFRDWLKSWMEQEYVWGYEMSDFPYTWKKLDLKRIEVMPLIVNKDISTFLYLGNTKLTSHPEWRDSQGGRNRNIEFTRSQVVCVEPSILVNNEVLLEGRVAICGYNDYLVDGIDPHPIEKYYLSLRASLKKMMNTNVIITQKLTNGTIKQRNSCGVTTDVLLFSQSAKCLKQFIDGSVCFSAVPVSSVKVKGK